MDDILASIRRILDDEEKVKETAAPGEPIPRADALPMDDVLMLDSSMLVEQGSAAAPDPAPLPEPVMSTPAPLPVTSPPPPLPPPPSPPPALMAEPTGLVAPEAAAAAASSVGSLLRTLATERSTAVHRGGPTLEDLVREEMRPLLKQWLDTNLPPLVERLVRAEIERVVNRMAG